MRTIATALLLVACSSGANEETLVDELTVLGLAARPPEVGPGEELALDVVVVDPDKEDAGFDLMVWFCTAYSGGCFERGPEPRALTEWASVFRDAQQVTTATFTVPPEFALLLPEADADEATVALERLRFLVAERLGTMPVAVTCSLGAVVFRKAPEQTADMISATDRLMYAAKAMGKNRLHLTVAD